MSRCDCPTGSGVMVRASVGSDAVGNRSDSRLSPSAESFVFILSLSLFNLPKCYGLETLFPGSGEETL